MQRKVKTFLHVLAGSIVPQSSYYAKVLKTGFFFSIAYCFTLLGLTSIIIITITIYTVNQSSSSKVEACLSASLKAIPTNFSLHLKNGYMSTNHDMPLFIWFSCEDKIRLLAVLDERASEKSIYTYGAHMLLTGAEAVFRYRNYTYSLPFQKHMPYNVYLNKDDIVSYSHNILSIIKTYLPVFLFTLTLITPLIIIMIYTVTSIISAFFVFLFYRLFYKRYSIKKIVQIGFHSGTLPLLVSIIFVVFPINIINMLLTFFTLFFVFQLVAVYEAHYTNSPPIHHKRKHVLR
ncbi:MAG: DUF1189 family protein [Patescibacteria group bacterium]